MTTFTRISELNTLCVCISETRTLIQVPTELLPSALEFHNASLSFSRSRNKESTIYSVFHGEWTMVADKGTLTLVLKGFPSPIKFSTSKEISAFKRYLKD